MATTMEASVKKITDGQIEDAVAKFRDALRTHREELFCEPAQRALGMPNIGMECFAPLRARAEAMSEIIIRRVKVDRSLTPQQVVNATGRKQYVNRDVLDTMPKGEGNEVDVWFIPTKGFVSAAEAPAFLAQYGLVEDPRAAAAVNVKDNAFADEHPNAAQWGKNCYLTFGRWRDERGVYVYRGVSDWRGRGFLSGVPASRK